MCKFASVDGNNLNDLKKLVQIMPTRKNFARQAQGHLWRALSNKVHHEKVGGLHPTHGGTGGKIGTRRKLKSLEKNFLTCSGFRLRKMVISAQVERRREELWRGGGGGGGKQG